MNGIITRRAALSVVVAVLGTSTSRRGRPRSEHLDEPGAPISAASFAVTVDGVQIGTFESLISETDPAARLVVRMVEANVATNIGPGDFFEIPAGHDAYVDGNERVELVLFAPPEPRALTDCRFEA